MAKITKGNDFKGVVDYILDKDKNAQVIAFDGLFMENKDTIAMSFNVQWQMNNKVSKHSGEKHQGRSGGVDFSLKTVIINDD